MRFSYLTQDNVFEKYKDAKAYTDKLTDPFPEFERLAQNKPHPSIDKRYPKTTDGTAASIVRKTGKRIVQQLPTGQVKADGSDDWLSIVADYIYRTKIIPHANDEFDLIQKCWTAIEKALTFGSVAIYTPFVKNAADFTADFRLIYWGDLALQPGKRSGYGMKYTFLSAWYQKEDIDALIDREAKLAEAAKKRGEKYESTWKVDALNAVKDHITQKDEKAQTPHEKARQVNESGVLLVTGFQEGVGAEFITFNPESREIVRVAKNKDPRGKMPIDWLYGDTDGSNPLGRGIMELIGGLQNLIDSDMQMYQFNRALSLAPPLVKKGSFNKNRIQFIPNHIIDLGSDANASIDALKVDTSALVNYPSLYGLQKSQMLNLVPSPDTSIGTEVGNPGFGKTPTALNQQKASLSVDDNYVRKMFEAMFGNWSETAINIYFAERSGKEILKLDEETVTKLEELAKEGKFDMGMLNDDQIIIDYDTATPGLKFTVDASTSKMQSDADRMQSLTGLLDIVGSNPMLAQVVPQDKILAAYNSIVMSSGVEDPENLLVDIEELKQQQMMAQEQAQAMTEMPAEASQDVPQAPEAPMTPDDQLMAIMQQSDPETIANVTDLYDKGYSAEQILGALNG